MYLARTLEKSIEKISNFFPVLLVTGPRQVGKTTVLQACAGRKRNYVSLGNLDNRSLAQSDPGLFLQRFRAPLFIDDIQYAPQLFPSIKAIVDQEKQPGLYWLAGSQHFPLMKNVTENLAGRVGILHLEGLSLAERDGQPDRPPFLPVPESLERRAARAAKSDSLFHLIWKGAYPQMHGAGDDKWASFYGAYVQTSIERDVRDMGAVGSELAFLAFMKALAARTGQLLNCSDIAREVGKSAPTIRAWVSRLRTSGLIVLLPSYPHAAGSRVIKTPRIYFMDTGLACFLTGWTSPQTLECGAMSGAMLETFVVSEILKSWWHNGRQPNMFSYRDKDRREISILLEENGVLHPVAITRKTNPARGDIRAFGVIEKVLGQKRGHGAVLCMTQTPLPVRSDVDAGPIHCI